MGARQRKKSHKIKRQHQPSPPPVAVNPKPAVTIDKKNDTIPEPDFFGFSPRLFWSDLGRTAWGTAVMLIVLAGVYLVTK